MYLKSYNHDKQKILLEMSEDEFQELCELLETHQMSRQAIDKLNFLKTQREEKSTSGI